MNKQQILDSMVHACITGDTKSFLPALKSAKVGVMMPDKERFFKFFEYMVKTKKKCSKGRWYLRIEDRISDEYNYDNPKSYKFYDTYHKYPRLLMAVSEKDEMIYIDTCPF